MAGDGATNLSDELLTTLKDLAQEADSSRTPVLNDEQIEELRTSLWYLNEHIRILETWVQRGDVHPGLQDCAQYIRSQFNEVLSKLPPKK